MGKVRKKDLKMEDFVPENGEEMTDDDIELEDMEEQSKDKLKKLRNELKACQKEKQEYLDGWQRAKADILNSKKRASEELDRSKERAAMMHIEKLLPLCDSFRMAMVDSVWKEAPESWKKGIEQTHSQLQQIMKEYGVEEVGEVGETFDPNIHEAVSTEEGEGDEKVTQVLQKGYRMGDQLIRPAKVIVKG